MRTKKLNELTQFGANDLSGIQSVSTIGNVSRRYVFVCLNDLREELIKHYHQSEGNKHKFIREFLDMKEEDFSQNSQITKSNSDGAQGVTAEVNLHEASDETVNLNGVRTTPQPSDSINSQIKNSHHEKHGDTLTHQCHRGAESEEGQVSNSNDSVSDDISYNTNSQQNRTKETVVGKTFGKPSCETRRGLKDPADTSDNTKNTNEVKGK